MTADVVCRDFGVFEGDFEGVGGGWGVNGNSVGGDEGEWKGVIGES